MERNEDFNLEKIKDMSPTDAKAYIDKYFFILSNGKHAFYNFKNKQYEISEQSVIRSLYFNRMSSELDKYYFKEKTNIKQITYDIHKPELYETYLNMCPKIKHSYVAYDTFDETTKQGVELMLSHIKEILCSSNQAVYEFLLKWFANMVRGNRNDSCLYLKGLQGAGKSTPIEFIRDYVIGRPLCVQCGSGPFKSKWNSELSGKIMVALEELENISASEWISVSAVLKRQITAQTLMIEPKGQDPREEPNLNNYIILSNHDAVQDDDGRRYFILDISTKQICEHAYFKKIYDGCFNDKVGHAFYCYLLEVNLDNYYSQQFPMTQSKLDSFSKRLDIIAKFLKYEYILKRKSVDRISVTHLYDKFCRYCSTMNAKPKTKIDFNKHLKDLGIEYKKSNGNNLYDIPLEFLCKLADKFKWIHELDEYEDEQSLDVFEDDDKDNEEVVIDYEKLYKEQLEKNKALEAKIQELKSNRIVLKNVEFEEFLIDATIQKPINIYHKITPTKKQPITDYDDELGDDLILFKTLKSN